MKHSPLADRTLGFDVNALRSQFPVLARMVRGKPSGLPGQRGLGAASQRRHRAVRL